MRRSTKMRFFRIGYNAWTGNDFSVKLYAAVFVQATKREAKYIHYGYVAGVKYYARKLAK